MFYFYRLPWRELSAKADARMDQRAQRTRHAIHTAFVSLLGKKNYNEITVTDIAEEAHINRKTFYNYYEDIHAVVDEVGSVAIKRLNDALEDSDFVRAITDPGKIFRKIVDSLGLEDGPYAKLFRNDYYGSLASGIAEMVKERWKRVLLCQDGVAEEQAGIFVDYAVSGMVSLYRNWASESHGISFESLTELAGVMTVRAYSVIMGV